jgi:hypothetical protein
MPAGDARKQRSRFEAPDATSTAAGSCAGAAAVHARRRRRVSRVIFRASRRFSFPTALDFISKIVYTLSTFDMRSER